MSPIACSEKSKFLSLANEAPLYLTASSQAMTPPNHMLQPQQTIVVS